MTGMHWDSTYTATLVPLVVLAATLRVAYRSWQQRRYEARVAAAARARLRGRSPLQVPRER